jgi:hypothetical protein
VSNSDSSSPDPGSRTSNPVDLGYEFGRPLSMYLSQRQIVRLTILRSRLFESLCGHASLARRREEAMDVHECAECRAARQA